MNILKRSVIEDKTPTNGAVTNKLACISLFLAHFFSPSSSFQLKNMANFPLLQLTLSLILLLSTLPSSFSTITQPTSTVTKDQVPCTMCSECENPCHPLPPPPPPVVIHCPPPPSPPPPSPPPPVVVECPPPPKPPTCSPCETLPPPPPKPPCEGDSCLPSLEPPMPETPGVPVTQYPPGPPLPPFPPGSYFPPGTPLPQYGDNNADSYSFHFFTLVALLSLPYYLFIS
ncbi:hypothetical protein VNO77_13951 [Canavalia gladiata]|uniref:Uncharacterized protein n=1 Tax=Canavalia gladiata TaxID=3824 RepID=A0AAN9QQS4_CANGL